MILPVLLIVLEGLRWRRRPLARRSWGGVALRILPVVALVIGYVVVRGHLLGAASFGVNEWQGTGTLHSGHHRGMATQLATMALLLPGALAQFILPHGLTMDPVIQYIDDWTAPAVWAGVVLMVVLTALGLASPRRHPTRFLGTCLAWGCALPWVVKPLNLPFLEHRLYGSLAGLAMVVSTLLPRIDRRALWARPARAHLVAPRLALVAVVAVVAVVAAFAAISARRSAEFATAETLWSLELQRNPDSKVAMAGMAVCRMRQQRFADARVYLRQLIVAYPERADARVNLAECELQSGVDGDPGVAVEQARHLAAQDPRNPFHRLLLSRALAAVGVRRGGAERFDEAVAAALSCLEIAAPKGLVYRTAASARRLQGDLDAAIELLDRSVARGLAHSSVLLDRAQLLMARGRWSQARRDLAAARQQDPFNPAVIAAFDQLVNRPAVQPPR
jgi:tetratricopeptide (TPR) repeat protein